MLTEERAPVRDRDPEEDEIGVREASFDDGPAAEVRETGAGESSVWSASASASRFPEMCKSNDDPHFEQEEDSSAFSVRHWGQIMI
ncbi:MAG: hypothetical protein WBE20_05295 [Candidatus Acidiferrales bacterium]